MYCQNHWSFQTCALTQPKPKLYDSIVTYLWWFKRILFWDVNIDFKNPSLVAGRLWSIDFPFQMAQIITYSRGADSRGFVDLADLGKFFLQTPACCWHGVAIKNGIRYTKLNKAYKRAKLSNGDVSGYLSQEKGKQIFVTTRSDRKYAYTCFAFPSRPLCVVSRVHTRILREAQAEKSANWRGEIQFGGTYSHHN